MCLDRVLVLCTVIFGVLWMDIHALSPMPSIPEHVPALAGSCVVIPCYFTYPALNSVSARQERMDVRLTYKGSGTLFPLQGTAFNSVEKNQVSRNFKGRTALWGNTADGDCSVKIERVNIKDSLVYDLALKRSGDLHWGKAKSIHLVVSSTPDDPVISGTESVTDGQVMTLNCTINYFCPAQPPILGWHWERGAQENSSELWRQEELIDQKLVLLASLSFTASFHIKSRVRCEAVFPGDRRSSAVKYFQVTFSPKDVTVQVHTLIIQEGASVLLACVCKADPPVLEYHWSYTKNGHIVKLHQRAHTVRMYNVTRNMRVRCSAQNVIGRSESMPITLNIQYKPFIVRSSSSCVMKGLEVLCLCAVDSNPRPAVTWNVNGSISTERYNTSMISHNGTLAAVLKGPMGTPLRVVCFAMNSLGNDSHTLLEGGAVTSSLLWRVIPAATISLTVFVLSIPLLYCCRRRAKKRVLSCRPPSACPGELGIYQDQMPLYINCTEVTHIYNNGGYQLVYQNCTPLFVHTKQNQHNPLCQMMRREVEGRREASGGVDRATGEVKNIASTESETAIYLEII